MQLFPASLFFLKEDSVSSKRDARPIKQQDEVQTGRHLNIPPSH